MYHNEFINDVTYCLEANSCPIFSEYNCDVETGSLTFSFVPIMCGGDLFISVLYLKNIFYNNMITLIFVRILPPSFVHITMKKRTIWRSKIKNIQ